MFRWIGKSSDGLSVTLHRLQGCPVTPPPYAHPDWMAANANMIQKGLVLDIETTGLNQGSDQIIEIALRQFLFHRENGDVLALGASYTGLQDPGQKLSPEIRSLTGLSDEILEGQSINWSQVDQLLDSAELVIAHNAQFDRPFVDRKSRCSSQKIWGCSFKHIDWSAKGFTSSKLELLNIYHGFFTDSHRALNDVDALLYLLSLPDSSKNTPYLKELIFNAQRPMTHIIASSSPFESKDHLKGRGYRWDNVNRFWSKVIFRDQLPSEISWLEEQVYGGTFGGITREIALADSFKS